MNISINLGKQKFLKNKNCQKQKIHTFKYFRTEKANVIKCKKKLLNVDKKV